MGREDRSAAKLQPQTGGPEPTKRYQLHAEDAEESRGHKTLNPRLCVTRRPLRENPRETVRSCMSAVQRAQKFLTVNPTLASVRYVSGLFVAIRLAPLSAR